MQELNTQLWNLGKTSFVAALGLGAAACGPAVGIEGDTDGAETESSSDMIIDPSTPTDTDPTDPTDPTAGGCDNGNECPDGFYCGAEGQCIEDYSCDYDDYGCYCVYGHCQPGYDCYDDDDCATGEICEGYGYCNPVQTLPDCGDPATLVGTPVQIPTGNAIEALAFVDLDPDTLGEDLVVGTDIDGWLIPSGGEAVALSSEGPVRAAASADLDGDAQIDLIVLDDQGLRVTYGYGTETAQTVTAGSAQPFASVHTLRNAEGLPSLAVLDALGVVLIIEGSPERLLQLSPLELPTKGVLAIEPFAFGDGSDGIVWESQFGAGIHDLANNSSTPLDGGARAGISRQMAVGSLAGSERSDILWASLYKDWTRLEVSIGGDTPEERVLYFDYESYAIGDLDGNGLDDVLAVGGGGLAVMPGDADWGVTCFSQSPFVGGASRTVAVGDLDGDGSDEAIVITDAGGAPMQYDVSWAP